MPDPDLRALLESWTIHLRAERKAEGTVRLYATGVRAFLAWCDRQGRPATLDRPTVATFIAELLNDGREARGRRRLGVLRGFQPTMSAPRAREAALHTNAAAYTDAVSEYAALGRDELREAARTVMAVTSGRG